MIHIGKRKRTGWTVWITIVLLVVVGIGTGCQPAAAAGTVDVESLQEGDIVTAFIGDLASSASASGQLIPEREAQLALNASGSVEQVVVAVGDRVQAGDVLLELESAELERAVQTAEQNLVIQKANLAEMTGAPDPRDIAAAEASVVDAQAQLDDLLAGPSEKELAQAQASLVSAQAQLDDLLAGPSAADLAQAQDAVTIALKNLETAKARNEALAEQVVVAQNDVYNAQLSLDRAQDTYNQFVWNNSDPLVAESWGPYSGAGVALAKAQVSYDVAVANHTLTTIDANDSDLYSAVAQVAQAQASLEALTQEQTAQIASAQALVARAEKDLAALVDEQTVQVASARAQLAQAEASLEQLLEGPSAEQIVSAEVAVDQARLQLLDAQSDLTDAVLVAPFDGLVTGVYVVTGEQASGAAIELVNTDSMQVVLDVDEVDLAEVEEGQAVNVELEAWPDRVFQGQVASIAPRAKNVGGIVSFEVRLDVDWQSGMDEGEIPLLTGMTADADLITSQRTDVLLVSNRAITADRDTGTYSVYRIEGEDVVQVEVTIGLRDKSFTEITSGLQEGDELVIGYGVTAEQESSGGMPFGGGQG